MEQTATSSHKIPFISKLQELLTSDRTKRRSDLIETSSAASISGDSLGDDGTNSSSDAMSDKYRNPRKRLLLSSMNASEADESADDQSGKRMMKWKPDVGNGTDTGDGNQGPASFTVAPIVLKKCYPNAVQSAECEEFLVSLSEDDTTQATSNGGTLSQGASDLDDDTQKLPIKSKDDLEYMGAQIDKLLSMPSPKSSWKAPRRQRRFQCPHYECPKSYSTEDDLKSHILSHSEGGDSKPFGCDLCDKKFKWAASVKVHKQKLHGLRSPSAHYESESSQEENSPSASQEEPQLPLQQRDDKIKMDVPKKLAASAEVTKKSGPPSLNIGMSQQDLSQSFESVVSKMLSSGLVATVTSHAEKPVLTRRQLSAIKDAPPTKKSAPRKEGKPRASKLKTNNDAKKKASAVAEEAEEPPSPQTPTTGRSSLRRNIQRPKWLSDADLVTDYEFPRGTNPMRLAKTTSSPVPTPATLVVNGNQKESRTVSTSIESDESVVVSPPKSQKSDKNKACPPVSRDRKRKEEITNTAPKKDKKEKKAEKKESIQENSGKNVPRRTAKHHPPNDSPTKQLSTKVLTLTLEDCANKPKSDKLAPEKNNRKRSVSEDPVLPVRTPERKSKRKRSAEGDKNKQSNGVDSADPKPNLRRNSRSNNDDQNNEGSSHEGGVETINNSLSITNDAIDPQNIESTNQSEKTSNVIDTRDAKKIEEVVNNFDTEKESKQTAPVESVPAQTKEVSIDQGDHSHITDTTDSTEHTKKPTDNKSIEPNSLAADGVSKGDESIISLTMGANNSAECEAQKIDTETTSRVQGPFFNCEALSFADIAKGFATKPAINNTIVEAVESEDIEEGEEKPETTSAEHLETTPVPVICSNLEDMPILRPETSSSAAGSRSDSFAERMQSIDEDVSSSSNHSMIPQAPVLSKEATDAATNFANGIIKIKECKIERTNSSATDNQEELSLIDEDEVGGVVSSRSRRDRSDSLSMRSCGSGSQSEKIKALEDNTTSKEKRTSPSHECLVDSDSNDSLMSEFSELAAQISEKTDGVKFKEECIRFLSTKVSANSMWAIRKELKRLKKDKNYFKFGKLSPLAAGLMHDIFCQSLE